MKNILIIGSTGKLGTKLVNFCYNNNIKIKTITCFNNFRKVRRQENKLKCLSFNLSNDISKKKFIHNISKIHYDLVYFLDYGYHSIYYFNFLLNKKKRTIFAIANKELLITGGRYLINKIFKSGNEVIPLDSEHFSLYKTNLNNDTINKVYITASGGPFYFDKKINLTNVSFNQVINHPKWNMGINNSIDSSNFVNKILEIYELSSIYNIDLNKISFLLSQNAFVHSIIFGKDRKISLNCFNNDMLITLTYPLSLFYKFKSTNHDLKKILNVDNFNLNKFVDKRFKIYKYLSILKKLNHRQQIEFLILNNIAHKLYLEQNLKYNNILDFIMHNLNKTRKNKTFKSINHILTYVKSLRLNKYEI